MTHVTTFDKKRDMLAPLNKAIVALSNLSGDAAKLEFSDNDQASRRLKKRIAEFTHGELKELKEAIYSVRDDINQKKRNKSNK